MLVWKMSSDKGDPQPSLKACTLLIPESAVSNCHNFETKKKCHVQFLFSTQHGSEISTRCLVILTALTYLTSAANCIWFLNGVL